MTIKVVVTGVFGRMGTALVKALEGDSHFSLVGATERQGMAELSPSGVAQGHPLSDDLTKMLSTQKPKVVIDFTSAEASAKNAAICAEQGVALVCGSTGFTQAQREALKAAAGKVAMVVAPNMSVGMNVVIAAAADLAKRLGEGFDADIFEVHHRHKKDSPSGTALRLADEMSGARGVSRPVEIRSVRAGDAVGDHTVVFYGQGERVELSHKASSREQFALGALRAARWVIEQKPGLYSMKDVLGL
jgi:4-hydroxy-tetrahydrodipicolinate reductase